MPNLAVTRIPLDKLQPYHRNPRRGNIPAIAESLQHLGQYRPIVVNEGTQTGRQLEILAGNHTYFAARDELGWDSIDIVLVDVDEHTAAKIVAVDNRSSDLATNDDEVLAGLLSDLPDLAGTGYSDDDLDALLADLTGPHRTISGEDAPPEPPSQPVTKPGDMWLVGSHRVICGDSRNAGDVARLLDGARINIAFTSPPYASQRTYDESSGFKPIPPDDYVDWFEDVQANVRAHLAEDGSWFINIKEHCEDGQRHLYVKDLTIAHVRRWGWRFVDELCWVDSRNGFPGMWPNRFKDAWEPVFHLSANGAIKFHPLTNGTKSDDVLTYDPDSHMHMGEHGYRVDAERTFKEGIARPSNVIHVPAGGDGSHSAAFPVALPAWFIRAYSDPGDVVFDPFMGSGSTLIAAHQEGRVAYGVEISPAYCDVICTRWQKTTGVTPMLLRSDGTSEAVDFSAEADVAG